MPTKREVLQAIGDSYDYVVAASRLGIPAGEAYLIATGIPADGGDATAADEELSHPGVITTSTQYLVYQRLELVNSRAKLDDWLRRRAGNDAQMVAAARARVAEPGEPEIRDDERAKDLCEVLARQHDQVTALVQQLKTIPGITKGGSEVQQSRRKSIVDMITVELAKHETAEQEHFWPAVRGFFDDGDDVAAPALQQEQQSNETLAALADTAPSEGAFDELAEELEMKLRQHVAYEEKVLLDLRDNMSLERREEIGGRILRAENHAPTRAHPHAPRRPAAAVKAAAASAAPLDKARDRFGNRPAKRRGRAEHDAESPTEEDR